MILATEVVTGIQAQLAARPDVEHCGVLLTNRHSAKVIAWLAYPGPLMARSFRLPDDWLLKILGEQRSRGRRIVGYYHTHPLGEALLPSPEDVAGHPPGSLVLLVGDCGWQAFRAFAEGWVPSTLMLE